MADVASDPDPYTTLGVAIDASAATISRAYRTLAKRWHPDLNPGDADAEARFKVIASANELLSDPEKRARFDRGEIDAAGQERARPPPYQHYAEGEDGRRYGGAAQPDPWAAAEFGDIFGSMFGASRRRAGPLRGDDRHYTLEADFLDAVRGATRRLALPDGRTLEVKIPPGTSDGHTLRLRGQGGAGQDGGGSGDALIEVHVQPHPFYRREGADIRLVLPVSLPEAVLGGPVEVPTPGGPVRMRVPAASETGTELRLRGRGVPAHGDVPAGDLYATLQVRVGPPDPALVAFLQGWTPEHPADPREALHEETS